MLQMDLPHLNVLTKIDNLINYAPLPLDLEFYTEAMGLEHLLPLLDAERPILSSGRDKVQQSSAQGPTPKGSEEADQPPPESKFHALNAAIVDLVSDFGLVGFETLAVEDRTSMMHLLRAIDRAGGYAFGGAEGANDTVWQVAMRDSGVTMDVRDVQERWIDRREEFDELERKQWEAEGQGPAEGQGSTAVDGDSDDEMTDLPLTDSGIKVVRKG